MKTRHNAVLVHFMQLLVYGYILCGLPFVALPQFLGDVEIQPRELKVPSGTTFDIKLLAFVGMNPLGAYDIALTFDPTVVIVEQISAGATAEFSYGPLATSPSSSFTSGTVRLIDFNTSSLTAPIGQVSMATITFRAVGEGGDSTLLHLTINTLADTSRQHIFPMGRSALISLTNRAGDIDGDGDVDLDDLDILLEDLNKSVDASACGAPCDLDGDGVITALDARRLALLCTRPGCATQ